MMGTMAIPMRRRFSGQRWPCQGHLSAMWRLDGVANVVTRQFSDSPRNAMTTGATEAKTTSLPHHDDGRSPPESATAIRCEPENVGPLRTRLAQCGKRRV